MPQQKKRKLGPKTVDCVFLGYARNSAAYRFLVLRSETSEIAVNTVIESRDATFFESIFPMRGMSSGHFQPPLLISYPVLHLLLLPLKKTPHLISD